MTSALENQLIAKVTENIIKDDPSHDIEHVLRVLKNAKIIAEKEGADLEIVIPAALFHDFVTYPKNDSRNKFAVIESADEAEKILTKLDNYPQEKIEFVKQAIKCTSYSYGQKTSTIEDKVVKDADMLEMTGAIAIMRTFASTGKMNRPFYDPNDPFAKKRSLDALKYAVDLFYTRLLKVMDEMSTETARKMAKQRTEFLYVFLQELKEEIGE